MPDLIEMVKAMTPEESAVAVAVLDACSRPLTVREIEALLRRQGQSKSAAVKLATMLQHWSLIAVVGPEGAGK